ncbi:MAG TPA: hypothetical protein VGU90_11980, partial [Terriglobales bacterium]|nr:hypothetical protein [Terriglobales bacterium]
YSMRLTQKTFSLLLVIILSTASFAIPESPHNNPGRCHHGTQHSPLQPINHHQCCSVHHGDAIPTEAVKLRGSSAVVHSVVAGQESAIQIFLSATHEPPRIALGGPPVTSPLRV